ncbi:MAG: MFS transporter [Myxococcales bacterium]|nr:MFS transporter [Myxococcales bacterium]
MATLRREVARFPRAYWVLWTGMLVNRAGAFVLPFLMLYFTEARGLSEDRAGLVWSLFGAGSIVATMIGGQLADRWGRRPTMIVSLVGMAGALGALAAAEGLALIALATFGLGLLGELYRPAVSATVADLVPPANRGRAYGHLYWAHNLGFAIAPVVGAALVGTVGYQGLFAGDALTALVCAAVIVFAVPESRPVEASAAGGSPIFRATALADGVFVVFLGSAFLTGLLMVQLGTVLPLLFESSGVDAVGYGRIIALNGAIVVVVQPLLAGHVVAWPRTPTLVLGTLLFTAGFVLHGFVSSVPGHIVGVAIWSVGEVIVIPLSATVVADLASLSHRGRYQGAYAMAWGFALLAGPIVGTAVLARGAASGWALLVGAAGLVAALGHLVLGPRRRARELLAVETTAAR